MKDFINFSLEDWLVYEYNDNNSLSLDLSFYQKTSGFKCSYDFDSQSSDFSIFGLCKPTELKYLDSLSVLFPKTSNFNFASSSNIYYQISSLSTFISQRSENSSHLYSSLIKLCLGSQLFHFVVSRDFPSRNTPDFYTALFYSYVVLGMSSEAYQLYKSSMLPVFSYYSNTYSSDRIILENIRCLFYLKSKLMSLDQILSINEMLIDIAKENKFVLVESILWLNRSRLYKIEPNLVLSRQCLIKSFNLVNHLNLWKQRLYFVLQMASIKGELNSLVKNLFSPQLKDEQHIQAFGWRIAHILCKHNYYSSTRILTNSSYVNILKTTSELEDLYTQIVP